NGFGTELVRRWYGRRLSSSRSTAGRAPRPPEREAGLFPEQERMTMLNREPSVSPSGTPSPGVACGERESRSSFPCCARRTNALPVRWVSGLRWVVPLLALLLGLGAATPARATTTTISTAVTGPLTVNSGDVLDIVAGGSVTIDDDTSAAV